MSQEGQIDNLRRLCDQPFITVVGEFVGTLIRCLTAPSGVVALAPNPMTAPTIPARIEQCERVTLRGRPDVAVAFRHSHRGAGTPGP
jgi:hypothetical protein